jgi:hypothetical protein
MADMLGYKFDTELTDRAPLSGSLFSSSSPFCNKEITFCTQWMAAAFSVRSLPSGILLTGMHYGNQTQEGYMEP